MSLENGLYADTAKLRTHVDEIAAEARTAQLLCEKIQFAQRLSELGDCRYGLLAADAEKLSRYFREMQSNVDNMCTELELLSLKISSMISESTDEAKRHFRAIDIISG